jgi:RNA polymerase sigma factor (sigma-70 family)
MNRLSLYANSSDGELVDLCLAGDRLAWEALILRYKKLMCSIPARYGFDRAECEDLVQNVWLALLDGLHTLRDRTKVYSWLITTTNRKCMALASEKQQHPVETEIEEPWDPARTQEQRMLWTEKQQMLRQVLERWPDPCSLLIRTLYFEEGDYQEAAKRLGVAPEGIGSRRARCLDRLRQMLSTRGITNLS